MLMPKRVKRRKQFRGSMAEKRLEEIKSQMVSTVSLLLSHAGLSPIRLRQPVLP